MTSGDIDELLKAYKQKRKAYSGFMNNVLDFFKNDNEALSDGAGKFIIHSVKFREKNLDHLAEKIERKRGEGVEINVDNLFECITDFCGVRVLHLRLSDFKTIYYAIMSHVDGQHWVLAEPPKAYTWDPEYQAYFEGMGVKSEIKESFYTSVHYVVKPNSDTKICCELQVRTLFEEIWGEVDHDLNYPEKTNITACREQLKVLAKLVGAGTKLVDSIYSSVPGSSL